MRMLRLGGLFSGLILSGIAGIINQVVWQRALKIFLGGSETLSAMIVVVVFLGGLGLGAAIAADRSERVRLPLLTLAAVELGLGLTNLLVTLILSLDITESVYAAERLAQGLGMPMRLVYGIGASILLLPPTILMGTTVPLAGAACQRQLGASSDRLVPVLFFVNTVGAAIGAWAGATLLLPWWGQRAALLAAIGSNLLASGAFFALSRGTSAAPVAATQEKARRGLAREEWIGGILGFLSLSYEMLLIRALTLSFEPLPATFAVSLAAFLIQWSIGVALAGRLRLPLLVPALLTALTLALSPIFHQWVRDNAALGLWPTALGLTLPCLGFGLLYGGIARQLAQNWGRDLGRFSATNTLGSCLGVVFFTLVGFEAPLPQGAWSLTIGLLAVGLAGSGWSFPAWMAGLGAAGMLGYGLTREFTVHNEEIAFWGRDGVVEVTPGGDVYIDGLWHTRLSDGADHIGEPYAWLMAAAAVIGRGDAPLRKALVIGAGIGVSSVTLAGVEGVQVDGYEINQTLRPLLEARKEATLNSLDHPALNWMWADARTGLALNESTYDLILSAPLHLRAAGSSNLLSLEYLDLLKSRLNPGGVVVVYANEGEDAQALLVQRTLAERFKYRVTWHDGMITVASDQPFSLDQAWLQARMARSDRFAEELRWYELQLEQQGRENGILSVYEADSRTDRVADRPITDDHPLLEHPTVAAELVRAVSANELGL